jgi:hypothetical protein
MTDEIKEPVEQQPAHPETQNPAAAPASEPPAGPDLNITDLASLKSIVEIATQRGAFKANELEAVGKTFNRLSTFIESVSKRD